MQTKLSKDSEQLLMEELKALDQQMIELDGKPVKPSQCYHWESEPAHLLYNTNCPNQLRQQLESIISKYVSVNESSAS